MNQPPVTNTPGSATPVAKPPTPEVITAPKDHDPAPDFDVLSAREKLLDDVREKLNDLPSEHRETIRRDLLRLLQTTVFNQGENPLKRQPHFDEPAPDGKPGVVTVPLVEKLAEL